MNKREAQAIETKNRITQIAIDMILNSNFNNVTVDHICSKANVSKGAFYHHFNSKSDIVVEIYKNKVIDSYQVENKIYQSTSSIGKIHETILSFLELIYNGGIEIVKQVFIHEIQTDLKYYISEGLIVFDHLKSLIEDGQKSGEIRTDLNSTDLSLYIIKFSRGLLYDWCIYKGKYNFIEKATKDLNLFLDSIRKL
ncbi:TetR/AcrR family transcriptional regulator [Clostridium weizhouense]|uniref:TetR/AcrR family transcriptional regulator n=1 Tax=Clostridium weizhouense TaxID=2859781 RepID=A0ABS7AQ59_9CLOT|nr:TetR/AcrR family transcriptional regulator [Clostridium weizhouense]MBW6410689.1 TetR/AcrR family transcriptional regulator [Clostridium weizhouense]